MKISIIIPTYNRPESLKRLLESIKRQTYSNIEVIIVDDASTNHLLNEEIARSFSNDKFEVMYIKHGINKGAPAARNTGIAQASGAWIAFVDDDDEWDPRKLEKQVTEINQVSDDTAIVYCWARYLDGKGIKIGGGYSTHEGYATAAIFRGNFMASPTVVVRRSVFERVGVFDTSLPSCQDWDMWSRILAAGFSCKLIPEELAIYNKHDGKTITKSSRAPYGYKRYIEKHILNIIRYTGPLNWGHKILMYIRVNYYIVKNTIKDK